jgi:L-lactate dehydrogenase complex protein LldE
MHIGGGLSRQRSGVTTMHFAEILASTFEHPAAVSDDVRLTTGRTAR